MAVQSYDPQCAGGRGDGDTPIKTVTVPEWSVRAAREGFDIVAGQTSGARALGRDERRLAGRGAIYEVS